MKDIGTIKVEIWSDVMCPFCYIGKRKFEDALSQFNRKDDVEITWKSFQLSPHLKTQSGKSINEYLAEHKGITLLQAEGLNDRVTQMAKQVGLVYNFDRAILANSFNAHRFTHFAKQHGKQDQAEEMLFAGYFTQGKNIDDYPTLIQMGTEIGLDASELKIVLESDKYTEDVRADIEEARKIGVTGVPFFVFNRKFAVSGAQESQIFLHALEKAQGA